MKSWLLFNLLVSAALATAGCASNAGNGDPDDAPLIAAVAQTDATATGEANAAVVVRHPSDAARSRIVATAALGGLELYDLAGKRIGSVPAGEVAALDISYGIALAGGQVDVVAAIDTTHNHLRLFTVDDASLMEAGARPLPLGFAAEGVCLFRNPLDSALYAFVVGDGGEIDQQIIYATADGKLDARQVRRINLPSPLKQCVADALGNVYASEETVGIWRFSADPEADVAATLVDAPRLGHIDEEVGGLALYDGTDGARWLLASDVSAGRVNVYDRNREDAFIGAFRVAAPAQKQAIGEPGPLFAAGAALGGAFPSGLLLVTDEDGANYKMLSFADIAKQLKLAAGPGPAASGAAADRPAAVTALVETTPVGSYGDAADDPAIWAHPSDPAKSLVIATDKKAGLYVYDMQGKVVQFLADGKMNNVDLRDDFMLGGEKVTLVTASNRTDQTIAIYRLDIGKRLLVNVADGPQPTGLGDPYGLCMYRHKDGGRTYVFINGDDTRKRQWELVDAGNGRVRAELVRDMTFDSQTEGCVADDETAALYVGEEDVALWRLSAEPGGGDLKETVDRVDANTAIKDDLEGMGLYDLGDGRGYLVVSSQGNDSYAVYRREGKQEYLGSFSVVADPVRGIDGISETDGLDVTSRNLGPGFEHGAMIAQDGRNVMPVENQNYKYVPWEAIARALNLEMRGD
ncbi:phytase [Pseudoxanthomonas wuyuanensis]|uniref:3-phytase n=1 Tax=Pseudoxanthomonas wuyuanensis TaxID=1073196 RepID=A0A286D6K3_9GAMM|nr:phytase [Pseudoxanthomonas wuyuanensis]KAF1721452.1 3-phytase [Pseudoxanthomonas wuyuanensis]SOD54291.1 3-phytase [Pseudoxanthomonas wuyuanensis]